MNKSGKKSSKGLVSRRTLILLGVIGAVILLFIGLLSLSGSNTPPRDDHNNSPAFEGMSSFIDSGLTTEQVNAVADAFLKFSPSAKTVAIDTSSLKTGPHNPNNSDPSFTINFKVSVDSKKYAARVKYSGLTTVQLFLSSLEGKQVYRSAVYQ